MKRIPLIFAVLFSLAVEATYAQHAKSFADLSDQKVGLYNIAQFLSARENLYYKDEKGKLKKIKTKKKDAFNADFLQAPNALKFWSEIVVDGKRYMPMTASGGNNFYLLIDADAMRVLLPAAVSLSEYEQRLPEVSDSRAYIFNKKYLPGSDSYTDKYTPVEWKGVRLSSDLANPVIWDIDVNGLSDSGSLAEIDSRHAFFSRKHYLADMALEKERIDSVADYDPIYCKLNGILPRDTPNTAFAFYAPDNKSVEVMTNFGQKLMPLSGLTFNDPSKIKFLQQRGVKGMQTRRGVAAHCDSISSAAFHRQLAIRDSLAADSIAREQAEIDDFIKKLKSRQIFIFDEEYAYHSYGGQFGKRIEFYNCFPKTIKYINIVFSSYNAVYDPQRDDLGRNSSKCKCIGPIEPGNFGTYEFDDLFWDNRDVISYVFPTSITFEFMDGTKKTFTGRKQIDAHRFSALDK